MREQASIQIRPFSESHREWATSILEASWGSTKVVSKGRLHDALQLPGFVALRENKPVGITTYNLDGFECELVTLNSQQPALGIGTALVMAVKEAAIRAESKRLWVITTNDNVAALRFYQQRGFRLAALYKDAVNASRRIKPQIPHTGKDGIPLRDELEVEIWLFGKQPPAIVDLHHAQITIPSGADNIGRQFYCQVMGLQEIEKPDSLRYRGGFWLRVGNKDVHVGVEDDVVRRSTKAHLAYLVNDLAGWRDHLEDHGLVINESIPIPGFNRFESRDPFGNRLEFIEKKS